MRHKGFTLIEIIVVIGLMLLLSALLFPVLGEARERARQATCVSNLRQLGVSINLYIQDYDGLFPRGGDPTDINTASWNNAFNGEFAQAAGELHPLSLVMRPYVRNEELWHCPADIGFDRADTAARPLLNARPTSFDAFGTSYYYRTELTLRRKIDLLAYESVPPYIEHGPTDINMLFDGSGTWHSGGTSTSERYNVLMADGRVINMTAAAFSHAWGLKFGVQMKQ